MTAPVMSWMNLGKDLRTVPQTQESNSRPRIRLLQKSCGLVFKVLNSVMHRCMDIDFWMHSLSSLAIGKYM